MQILLLLPQHRPCSCLARCVTDVKCFLTQQQIESGTNKLVHTGAKGVAKTLLLPLRDDFQVLALVPTQLPAVLVGCYNFPEWPRSVT